MNCWPAAFVTTMFSPARLFGGTVASTTSIGDSGKPPADGSKHWNWRSPVRAKILRDDHHALPSGRKCDGDVFSRLHMRGYGHQVCSLRHGRGHEGKHADHRAGANHAQARLPSAPHARNICLSQLGFFCAPFFLPPPIGNDGRPRSPQAPSLVRTRRIVARTVDRVWAHASWSQRRRTVL